MFLKAPSLSTLTSSKFYLQISTIRYPLPGGLSLSTMTSQWCNVSAVARQLELLELPGTDIDPLIKIWSRPQQLDCQSSFNIMAWIEFNNSDENVQSGPSHYINIPGLGKLKIDIGSSSLHKQDRNIIPQVCVFSKKKVRHLCYQYYQYIKTYGWSYSKIKVDPEFGISLSSVCFQDLG